MIYLIYDQLSQGHDVLIESTPALPPDSVLYYTCRNLSLPPTRSHHSVHLPAKIPTESVMKIGHNLTRLYDSSKGQVHTIHNILPIFTPEKNDKILDEKSWNISYFCLNYIVLVLVRMGSRSNKYPQSMF